MIAFEFQSSLKIQRLHSCSISQTSSSVSKSKWRTEEEASTLEWKSCSSIVRHVGSPRHRSMTIHRDELADDRCRTGPSPESNAQCHRLIVAISGELLAKPISNHLHRHVRALTGITNIRMSRDRNLVTYKLILLLLLRLPVFLNAATSIDPSSIRWHFRTAKYRLILSTLQSF